MQSKILSGVAAWENRWFPVAFGACIGAGLATLILTHSSFAHLRYRRLRSTGLRRPSSDLKRYAEVPSLTPYIPEQPAELATTAWWRRSVHSVIQTLYVRRGSATAPESPPKSSIPDDTERPRAATLTRGHRTSFILRMLAAQSAHSVSPASVGPNLNLLSPVCCCGLSAEAWLGLVHGPSLLTSLAVGLD
ncbi:hypothetical protein CYMTET_42447 [Cymbomonas tetramitiformis]|uniref:Uncharacterized protein n=1 Tax=Cymbomonas tetramitiformis TaxID=36881 RepID=A0AAE0F1N5_9CHLO|nr:hypothetical protein CYMTET_42447 [Cymbomonas tetramitiformis]